MKDLEFYYVVNYDNGKPFLVNAKNGEEAMKIVMEAHGYEYDVMSYRPVFISKNDFITLESVVL